MGAAHAAAYAGMTDVEVVGVYARKLDKAGPVAAICRARPVDDAGALVGDSGIDAIDVCLPSGIHAPFVIAALEFGKHVFCETPMALGLDDAHRMRDSARKAGRLLQVGLLMRSISAYRLVHEIAAAGTHGRLLSLATWRLGSYLHRDAPDHKEHYSDPTIELMTFDFDFIGWAMGRPARLAASGKGDVTALLDFADGRHATVAASGLMPPGAPFTVGFRALFEGACFELQQVFEHGPPRIAFSIVEGASAPRPVALAGGNPYEAELRRFVDCIAGKADAALLDADRAIEALMLSLTTQRALAEGRTIALGMGP
jgi:predicted dehydrogenase